MSQLPDIEVRLQPGNNVAVSVGASQSVAAEIDASRGVAVTPGAGAQVEARRGDNNVDVELNGGGAINLNDLNARYTRKLTADVTYYVDPTGSDSVGDGTSVRPFATIQHCFDITPKDLNGYTLTVHFNDGAYDQNLAADGYHSGHIQIDSTNSSAAGVTISGSNFVTFGFNVCTAYMGIANLSVVAKVTNGSCIDLSACAYANINGCRVGTDGIATGTAGVSSVGSMVNVYDLTDIDTNKVDIGVYQVDGISTFDATTCTAGSVPILTYGLMVDYDGWIHTPESAPDADYKVANKKYIDDLLAGYMALDQTVPQSIINGAIQTAYDVALRFMVFQSVWAFKYDDNVVPNTGIYFNTSTGQIEFMYLGNPLFAFNITNNTFFIGDASTSIAKDGEGNLVFTDVVSGAKKMSEMGEPPASLVHTTGDETIAGVKSFTSFPLTPSSAPVNPYDSANKKYVDDFVTSGNRMIDTIDLATTAALPACTYDNGTLGVGATLTGDTYDILADQDGITPEVGDTILVKDQADAEENGAYEVTAVGDGASAPFVLTRITTYDEAAEIVTGTYFRILEGTVNRKASWILTTAGTVVVGTTELLFAQLSRELTTVTEYIHPTQAVPVQPDSDYLTYVVHGMHAATNTPYIYVIPLAGGANHYYVDFAVPIFDFYDWITGYPIIIPYYVEDAVYVSVIATVYDTEGTLIYTSSAGAEASPWGFILISKSDLSSGVFNTGSAVRVRLEVINAGTATSYGALIAGAIYQYQKA